MSNIVRFNLIVRPTITLSAVENWDRSGRRRFILALRDGDGGGIVWDGATYGEALVAAVEWQRDGVRLIDAYATGRIAP